MLVLETSSGQVAATVAGAGEPVLLIHGFPLDHRMWARQLDFLAQAFLVVAPDLPGFGRSSRPTAGVSMRSFAEASLAVMEQVAPGQPFAVCGLSMGGYIAWQLVHHWPRHVARLVLCHTRAAGDSPEMARGRRIAMEGIRQTGPEPFLAAMHDRLLGSAIRAHDPAAVFRIHQWMREAQPDSLVATLEGLAERPDATPWLAAIDCPALVIAGAEDRITPADEMREMAGKIARSRFVLLEGVGHLSPCEAPEQFNRELLQFLRA